MEQHHLLQSLVLFHGLFRAEDGGKYATLVAVLWVDLLRGHLHGVIQSQDVFTSLLATPSE
jgi:hypothetical protein